MTKSRRKHSSCEQLTTTKGQLYFPLSSPAWCLSRRLRVPPPPARRRGLPTEKQPPPPLDGRQGQRRRWMLRPGWPAARVCYVWGTRSGCYNTKFVFCFSAGENPKKGERGTQQGAQRPRYKEEQRLAARCESHNSARIQEGWRARQPSLWVARTRSIAAQPCGAGSRSRAAHSRQLRQYAAQATAVQIGRRPCRTLPRGSCWRPPRAPSTTDGCHGSGSCTLPSRLRCR
jgi:hypothetical protein